MSYSALIWIGDLLGSPAASAGQYKPVAGKIKKALSNPKHENRNKQINRLFKGNTVLLSGIESLLLTIEKNQTLDSLTKEVLGDALKAIQNIRSGESPARAWGLVSRTGPDSLGWTKATEVEALYKYLCEARQIPKQDAIKIVEYISGMDLSDIYKAIEGKGSATSLNIESAKIDAAIACTKNNWWQEADFHFNTDELKSIFS